jgi:antitoxin PrlF
MNAIISEKGQVTIPKILRDNLGLAPGTVLDFSEEEGRIVARKVVSEDPISAWRGRCALPGGLSVRAYLDISRGNPAP